MSFFSSPVEAQRKRVSRPAYSAPLHALKLKGHCAYVLGVHHTDVVWERELPERLLEILESANLLIGDKDLVANLHEVKEAVRSPREPHDGRPLPAHLTTESWEAFLEFLFDHYTGVDEFEIAHLDPSLALVLYHAAMDFPGELPFWKDALWAWLGNLEATLTRRAHPFTEFHTLRKIDRATSRDTSYVLDHTEIIRQLEASIQAPHAPRIHLAGLFRKKSPEDYVHTIERLAPAHRQRLSLCNLEWAEELDELMRGRRSLVLIDSLHLYGKEGLLRLLRRRGWRVR